MQNAEIVYSTSEKEQKMPYLLHYFLLLTWLKALRNIEKQRRHDGCISI